MEDVRIFKKELDHLGPKQLEYIRQFYACKQLPNLYGLDKEFESAIGKQRVFDMCTLGWVGNYQFSECCLSLITWNGDGFVGWGVGGGVYPLSA